MKQQNADIVEEQEDQLASAISNRPIDEAMGKNFPDKHTVRTLWLKQAQDYNKSYTAGYPLYLTLCGAKALDIKLLEQHGIIQFTESGAMATGYEDKVVAIERSLQAVLEVNRTLSGINIVQQDFKSFIAGNSLLTYPAKKAINYCLAKIINLDFDGSLDSSVTGNSIEFPVLTWVYKVAQIHATHKPDEEMVSFPDFSIVQSIGLPPVSQDVQDFLSANFATSPEFREMCRTLLGEALYSQIIGQVAVDFRILNSEDRQKLLMVFVPKKISQLVHVQGWQVKTLWNLRYGGQDDRGVYGKLDFLVNSG